MVVATAVITATIVAAAVVITATIVATAVVVSATIVTTAVVAATVVATTVVSATATVPPGAGTSAGRAGAANRILRREGEVGTPAVAGASAISCVYAADAV